MNRLKLTITALFAAILSVSAVAPAMAKLYYNPDTNQWEEREVRASLRFSLGTSTTAEEIHLVGDVIAGVVASVRAAYKGAK